MRGIFDITNSTPSNGSSTTKVGYAPIGRRPYQSRCDSIDECPECSFDQAFKYPVVDGDTIYLQFRLEDNYNLDPTDPEFGWKTSSPSDDFWIAAELEIPGIENLELPHSNIIISNSVGWYAGSIQNLILRSSAIRDYLDAEASTDCFRVKITTYQHTKDQFTPVVGMSQSPTLPVYETWWLPGAFVVNNTGLYQMTNTPGVFDFVRLMVQGEIIFNSYNGKFYEFNTTGKTWRVTDPPLTKEVKEVCYSAWYKLVECGGTVVLRGRFSSEDCSGNYYGLVGGSLPFVDQYRIEASFEMTAITTEKTTNENEVITELKQYEEWLLRNTAAIPEQVVRRIANTFTAPSFTIDSNVYVEAGNVTKLNEDGGYWYIAPNVRRLLCEKETECGDSFQFNPVANCPVCEAGGSGEPVTVENSDGSYSETVDCGDTLVLEDNTYNVYFDGVLVQTDTGPAMINQTINIDWNA